jgi:hypothetical protein
VARSLRVISAALLMMAALAVGFGVAAARASAEVYNGSATFPAPTGTPSLNGPTPDPAQTAEYLHTLSASYDSQSGTVTIHFSLYDPATWGAVLTDAFGDPVGDGGSGEIDFELGWMGDALHPARGAGPTHSFCKPGDLPGLDTYALGGPVLDGSIYSEYDSAGSFTGNIIDTSLSGYAGDVTASVAFDGTTFTATIENPHFQGRVWDCFVLQHAIVFAMRPPPPPPPPPTVWNGGFSIRPRIIVLSPDGSSVLAGAGHHGRRSGRNRRWAGSIAWSSWTPSQAVGSGANWMNNCKPDCASGTYHPYPAKLRAYDPRSGHFTRLWVRIKYRGRWRTEIWKLTKSFGSWQWS